MDGFAGYKTAATEVIPDAVTVMDPFHVVALAGTKVDLTRQHIQHKTLGRRGHTGDPLYGIRRIARTRLHLLSTRRYTRLTSAFDAEEHLAVKSRLADLPADDHRLRPPRPPEGGRLLARVIDALRTGVPSGLEELATRAMYGSQMPRPPI